MPSAVKNPVKQRAGALGARSRWAGHSHRVVRMDSLEPEAQAIVRALLRLKASRDAADTQAA